MNESRYLEAYKKSHRTELHERGGEYEAFDPRLFAEHIIRQCAELAGTAEPFSSEDLILSYWGLSRE